MSFRKIIRIFEFSSLASDSPNYEARTLKRFTWRQPNSSIQRRLDFWLISNSSQEDIFSTDIIPAIKTDHSAITLNFKKIAEHKPGPSYWKFNSSPVNDREYTDFIKNSYPNWYDDRVTTDSAEILDQLKSFYSDLYQDHGSNSDGDGAA